MTSNRYIVLGRYSSGHAPASIARSDGLPLSITCSRTPGTVGSFGSSPVTAVVPTWVG